MKSHPWVLHESIKLTFDGPHLVGRSLGLHARDLLILLELRTAHLSGAVREFLFLFAFSIFKEQPAEPTLSKAN